MKKTAIGLICKKTICTCSTRFFAFFLPFCTTTTWNFQKLPGYPLNGGNVVRVLVFCFFLFFTSLMFTLVEASISHFLTAATKFHVVPRTKNVSFAFFSLSLVLSLVELCWPVALLSVFSIFLRLSLYSRLWAWQSKLDISDNTQKHFPFSSF